VDAEITVGGEPVIGRPARVSSERGSPPREIVVSAPGYRTARLQIVFDRDRSIVIPLVKGAEPVTGAADPAEPAKPKKTPGGAPPHATKKKDPLVTTYPR
jgi:hypothetical protein